VLDNTGAKFLYLDLSFGYTGDGFSGTSWLVIKGMVPREYSPVMWLGEVRKKRKSRRRGRPSSPAGVRPKPKSSNGVLVELLEAAVSRAAR
jgi:hypothetical protein